MPRAWPRVLRGLGWAALAGAAVLALGGCSALGVLDAATPRSGYVAEPSVAYGSGPRQVLDIYRPAEPAAGEKAPVVVFFYGGNWRSGERADYRFVAQALAARGALVLIPDYRLYPEVQWQGVLQDGAAATAWALKHAQALGGDPARIYVAGHSAGAWIAAMLALDARWLAAQGASPTRLAGWAGLAGPYNFLPIQNPDTKPVFDWPNTPADSQPIHHVRSDTAPARSLLIAANQDRLVDPEGNTEALAAALRASGGSVDVKRHGTVSHTTLIASVAWPLRALAPVAEELSAFVTAPAVQRAAR